MMSPVSMRFRMWTRRMVERGALGCAIKRGGEGFCIVVYLLRGFGLIELVPRECWTSWFHGGLVEREILTGGGWK
jgi:hypothetical protein